MAHWTILGQVLIKWPAELIGTIVGELSPLLVLPPAIGAGWLIYTLIMYSQRKSERANWRHRLALAISIVIAFWVATIFYQALEELAWTIIEIKKHRYS